MLIKTTTLTVAALGILSGCGKEDTGSTRRPVIPVITSQHVPAEYTLADPECQQQKGDLALTRTTIQAWEKDKVVPREVALQDLHTGESLSGAFITETTFRDVFERVCDLAKPKGHWCDRDDGLGEKSWYLEDTGGYLRICKDGHAYARDTYEGIALTSAHYLGRAFSRYRQLAPEAKAPAAIGLAVMPHFVDYYDNFMHEGTPKRLKTFITHNLAYFPTGQMIAVFPETVERAKSLPGFFWESEFVLSHEYGHHIDFSRHQGMLTAVGLVWDPLVHGFVDEAALAKGLSGETDRARLHGAVGEAFADLLAFYSEGGTSLSLAGLPEIGQNRDVAAGTFLNGDAKILTDDRLSVLFGLVQEPEKEQGAPRYGDIHIIGAIVARAADQAFAALTTSNPSVTVGSASDIDRRYQLALVWMDALIAEMAKLEPADTGSAVVAPLALAIEKTTDAHLARFPLTGGVEETIRAEICQRVKDVLPAVEKAPFAAANGTCG